MSGNRGPRGNLRPSQRLALFVGNNGAGRCNEGGLRAGDVVLSIVDLNSPGFHAEALFESTITEDGYIRQISTSNASSDHFLALVESKGR